MEATAEIPVYEVASLAEDVRVILIGYGWEAPGYMLWSGDGQRRHRRFYDLSRPTAALIPRQHTPEHWRPLTPLQKVIASRGDAALARAEARLEAEPTPAHAYDTPDPTARDTDWRWAYALPGFISRNEARHRVERAIWTSRCPGIVKSHRLGVKTNWPVDRIVRAWGDAPTGIEVAEFTPTRRDLDDWWHAIGWMVALYPPEARPKNWKPEQFSFEQKLVRAHALGFSFAAIADRTGKSREAVRKAHTRSIDIIWRAANAAP